MATPESESVLPFNASDLQREIDSVLHKAGIYDIGSYGWVNEDDPDPDLIGHAMWQLNQPLIDFSLLMGDQPVDRRPTEIEKEILVTGEDFCGLMRSSRLSIVLALLWKGVTGDILHEGTLFWLHHTDAFLKLAIASDRIRDLLIIASSGEAPDKYANKRKAFINAQTLLAARSLCDDTISAALSQLPELARQLLTYKDRRNEIVHRTATRMAKFARDNLSELQHRHDDEQKNGFVPLSYDGASISARLRKSTMNSIEKSSLQRTNFWAGIDF